MLVALIVAAVASVVLYRQRRTAEEAAEAGRAAAIRTAAVAAAPLERTLRLAGVTAAENFVSLISPQMRGSRSGFGRSGRSDSSSDVATQLASTAGRSSSSSSSSSSSGSSIASTANTTTTSAFSAATSRSATTSSISRTTSSSSSSSTSTSSTLGSDGLGSTSSSLSSGGGGGGGGGDFGLVLQMLAANGSRVQKGDVVAEFDRQSMLNRLDDYRASVAQTEAVVRKKRAQLEVTRKAHDQKVLAAKGAVDKAALDLKTIPVRSAIDSEKYRLALEAAEAYYKQLVAETKFVEISEAATIRDAEIELAQSKIELQRAENNVNRMVSKAPIPGLVVVQQTFRGSEFAQIQQGDQLSPGQSFMQIVDLRSMVVNATVNQVDVEKLRIGQKAHVRFDAYPDLEVPARVYSIGAMTKPGGFRSSFMKEIPVRLRLERLDPRVIPDLTVSADVVIEREDRANVVPIEAVFQDAPEASRYVYVRGPDGWLRREVETGLSNHTTVAIRSGLRPGDVVALSRPQAERKNGAAAPRQ